jgi:GDPmannose 4,6-dehydratase
MRALICGISGQDGTYLADLLLKKGYTVTGTSRDAETVSIRNLSRLGILNQIQLESMATHDFRSVLNVLRKADADEIYNLSGQSSVGLSFQQPVETLDSIISGNLNILEGIRFLGKPVRFYNAGSGECYGDTKPGGATEDDPFRPRSPYAVAKAAAFWLVANYREAYDLHASTGILFNHESPIRPARFVTRKIIATACRISKGSKEKLTLGNMAIRRDWGWAPEYVEAMWLMLQQEQPEDYVVATGETHSVRDFLEEAFGLVGLDSQKYVVHDPRYLRPAEVDLLVGDASKAQRQLGWKPKTTFKGLVKLMVEADVELLKAHQEGRIKVTA